MDALLPAVVDGAWTHPLAVLGGDKTLQDIAITLRNAAAEVVELTPSFDLPSPRLCLDWPRGRYNHAGFLNHPPPWQQLHGHLQAIQALLNNYF